MKTKYFFLTVLMLIVGTILTGFYINADKYVKDYQVKDKQAHEGVKKEQTGFDKEWQKFKHNADIQINKNEERIAEFKVKIKGAKEDVRVKYDKEVVVLEQKNAELKKKLGEYKYESKNKWEEFKKGFNRDMNEVGSAIKNFFSKKD